MRVVPARSPRPTVPGGNGSGASGRNGDALELDAEAAGERLEQHVARLRHADVAAESARRST